MIKNPPANAGDMDLIPGLGRSPGEKNGNLLQYSYLKNSMGRGVWWAFRPWGHKELDMTEQMCKKKKSKSMKWRNNELNSAPDSYVYKCSTIHPATWLIP